MSLERTKWSIRQMAGHAMWDGVKLTAFWLITNFLSIGVGKYFNLSVIGVLFLQGLLLGLILLVFVTIIGSRVSRRVDKLEAALSSDQPSSASPRVPAPPVTPVSISVVDEVRGTPNGIEQQRQRVADEYAEQFLQPGKPRLIEIRNGEIDMEARQTSAKRFRELQDTVRTRLQRDFGSAVALRFWFGKAAHIPLGTSVIDEAEARLVTLNDLIKETRNGTLAFKIESV